MNFYLSTQEQVIIDRHKNVWISYSFVDYILKRNIIKENEISFFLHLDPFDSELIYNLELLKEDIMLIQDRIEGVDFSFNPTFTCQKTIEFPKFISLLDYAIDNNLLICTIGD